MNRANLSKSELEWVRRELYRAAGVPLAQLDVSAVLEGQPDGGAFIRRFHSGSTGSAENHQLARPLAAQLETWGALAFFGL